ncbi:transposase [Mesorhizobium sp. M0955]|uniref:transposase n=1 Tax=unclassified Mesorhizobium TaxID=325217 RepID=UPI00333B22F3
MLLSSAVVSLFKSHAIKGEIMRRQTRPFIVEVKQRRGYQKRDNSLWGDMDLSAAFAETTRQLEEMDTSNRQFVDSNIVTFNAEHLDQAKVEHHMAETEHTEPLNAATKGAAKIETPGTKKKGRPQRNTKADLRSPAPKNGASSEPNEGVGSVRLGRKMYSEEERVQKLRQIEKLLSVGATLKSAVKLAGTSEQTYYQWKKKAAVAAPAIDDLKDLLALEEENKRLKNLLAERLRAENAELKRRLGL